MDTRSKLEDHGISSGKEEVDYIERKVDGYHSKTDEVFDFLERNRKN